jgi:hypothetical protein
MCVEALFELATEHSKIFAFAKSAVALDRGTVVASRQ